MSLKEKAVIGFIWTSVGSVGPGLLQLFFTFVLARLLLPADFGLIELITVISSISVIFIDSGFTQALIRDKEATKVDTSTIFFFNMLIAIGIYVLLFFMLPYIANFFNEPRLLVLARYSFLTIIIDAMSIVQNADCMRLLRFQNIAKANLFAIAISGVLGICLALYGYGVWALVVMQILMSCVKTIVLWVLSDWKPMLVFSVRSIRKYFSFGSFVLLHTLIDKIVLNLESIMIGRFYPKEQLAYYSQSRKIENYFSGALTNVIVKVSYPVLVNIQGNDEVLRNGYRKIIGLTTYFMFPFMVYFIFFPRIFIRASLGDFWLSAAVLLQLWACWGLLSPIQSICSNIFYVKGVSKQLFYLSVVKQIAKISVLFSLVQYSVTMLVLGVVVVSHIVTYVYVYYSSKLISYSLKNFVVDLLKNLIPAFIAAAFTLLLINLFGNGGDVYAQLCFSILIMGGTYFLLTHYLGNSNLIEARNILLNFLHKRKLDGKA